MTNLQRLGDEPQFVQYFEQHKHVLGVPAPHLEDDVAAAMTKVVDNNWVMAANTLLMWWNGGTCSRGFLWNQAMVQCHTLDMSDMLMKSVDPKNKMWIEHVAEFGKPHIFEHCFHKVRETMSDFVYEMTVYTLVKKDNIENLSVIFPHYIARFGDNEQLTIIGNLVWAAMKHRNYDVETCPDVAEYLYAQHQDVRKIADEWIEQWRRMSYSPFVQHGIDEFERKHWMWAAQAQNHILNTHVGGGRTSSPRKI